MENKNQNLIPKHGGYRQLKSYQTAEIIFDLTADFCEQFLQNKSNKTYRSYRTYDQMFQAARSGKQNIAEGSQASGTSKKTELKLIGVARASQEELLIDFQDFLRLNGLPLWAKDDPRIKEIRQLAYKADRSYLTYKPYCQSAEAAANCAICLIHQANFLLDQQLRALEKDFLEQGGFTEKLYRERKKWREENQ